jgi:hypothetical protein
MSASGRRQKSISTLPSFAFPSTADIAASALTGPSFKARPRHRIHQHIDVAAIDGDLVAIDMGRPIACQEQDGIGGLSNWPIRPSGAISSNLELHAKAA